jgi:hypothetical protein
VRAALAWKAEAEGEVVQQCKPPLEVGSRQTDRETGGKQARGGSSRYEACDLGSATEYPLDLMCLGLEGGGRQMSCRRGRIVGLWCAVEIELADFLGSISWGTCRRPGLLSVNAARTTDKDPHVGGHRGSHALFTSTSLLHSQGQSCKRLGCILLHSKWSLESYSRSWWEVHWKDNIEATQRTRRLSLFPIKWRGTRESTSHDKLRNSSAPLRRWLTARLALATLKAPMPSHALQLCLGMPAR